MRMPFRCAPRLDISSELLDGTADRRKNVVSVTAYQSYGSHYNDEDYRQHNCVFGNILTLFLAPQTACNAQHGVAFQFEPGLP